MDDDFSSVGSASFRPHSGRPTDSMQFASTFATTTTKMTTTTAAIIDKQNNRHHHHHHHPVVPHDDLLGIPPYQQKQQQQQQTQQRMAGSHSLQPTTMDESATHNYYDPVCFNIPPTDLRENFDVANIITTQTLRAGNDDGSMANGVQWEKVDTAYEGEDDYVPLVDYTKTTNGGNGDGSPRTTAANVTPTSRLFLARQRHEQKRRQKRQKQRRMVIVLTVGVAILAVVYHHYSSAMNRTVSPPEQQQQPSMTVVTQPLWQSFVNEAYSFEGEDSFVIVTLPKLPKASLVDDDKKKKKKRGIFGLGGGRK